MANPVARQWYDKFEGPTVVCTAEEGRTKQADKESCDINNILKRYEKTGVLPDMIKQNPQYGDFSMAPDYQEALNIVRFAEEQFAALDAHIRLRFDNDPEKFLAFASDDKNYDEMEKMGLLKPEVVKARQDAAIAKQAAEQKASEEAAAAANKPA